MIRPRFLVPFVACALFHAPLAASAAESYDNCSGFIRSVPSPVTTQGVWCLDRDLSTAIASGSAISIQANNVTIDCNGFKLGGLAAGNDSMAYGIYAANRQNVTIRNCNVRGFHDGIHVVGGGGHLVEDNQLDNNLDIGIFAFSESGNVIVRGNRVYDTGGAQGDTSSSGIGSDGDVLDNTVSGLFADGTSGTLIGIYVHGEGNQVRRNRVSGFASYGVGIRLFGSYQRVSGNQLYGNPATSGFGIVTTEPAYCLDNTVGAFTNSNIDVDCTGVGNVTIP